MRHALNTFRTFNRVLEPGLRENNSNMKEGKEKRFFLPLKFNFP